MDFFGRSPFLGRRIRPIASFPIEMVNGGRIERTVAGFDSGMTGTHLEIPSDLAERLGLVRVGTEMLVDHSGRRPIDVSVIDRIAVSGEGRCSVDRAKVWSFEGAPVLIGNDFMRDAGVLITYGADGVSIRCTGPSRGGSAPLRFGIFVEHRGKRLSMDAFFDTAWESSDIALSVSTARALGLETVGEETEPTPTGSYRAAVSRIDRMGLSQYPQCGIEDAKVKIIPDGMAFGDRVIVGQTFFQKTKATVGYGPKGATYGCP